MIESQKSIHLWGVKQNNLKDIELKIPLGSFTVVCGPSGSGKSSLAFETLFAEGQRRFIESMNSYARQFLNKAPKPDIEGIENIPPAIALEQKNSIRNSRSTVGTTTEILDYLRLLFEKASVCHCPTHKIELESFSISQATDQILTDFKDDRGYLLVEVSSTNRVEDQIELLAMFHADGLTRIYDPADKKNPLAELLALLSKTKKTSKGKFLCRRRPNAIHRGRS